MPTYGSDNMGTFVWVNNEREAQDYPVARNSGILMMHRTEPVMYMKQADAYGRSLPLEVYDLKKRVPPEPVVPQFDASQYVKSDDLTKYLSGFVTVDNIADIVKKEFDKLMK